MSQNAALRGALEHKRFVKSAQVLTGIVTGIVADGQLHDMEIQMLSTWLADNDDVTYTWPGSAIAMQLKDTLADGFISPEERAHLLESLQKLVGSDFSETGATSTETAQLPYNEKINAPMKDARICLTGEFIYGTRASCEKLAERAGCIPVSSVSKKVHYLVVGTHISPHWENTSYGQKIRRAMELQTEGHPIGILREKLWIDLLTQYA